MELWTWKRVRAVVSGAGKVCDMDQKQQSQPVGSFIVIIVTLLMGLFVGSVYLRSGGDAFQDLSMPNDPVAEENILRARRMHSAGKWREATELFHQYADEGHPVAMFYLARAYGRGWGVPIDLEEARRIFLRASQFQFQHRGQVAYELGRLYQRSVGKDCNRIAFEWFMKALEWQYPKAHWQLAKHFERGLGVRQNIDAAVFHYEAAAAAGFEGAAIKFARVLRVGRAGVPAQPQRAQILAEAAIVALTAKAAGGSASAAKTLGRLHRDGDFVDQSNIQATKWLRRASELGDPGAMRDLAHLIVAGAVEGRGDQEALGWLRRAAALGHGGAMTSLGRFHLQQRYGLERDGAVSWLERGVAAKHGGAMEELARLRAEGDLLPKDMNAAIALAREGAELGHTGSRTLYALLVSGRSPPVTEEIE